jgi:hypothetical protein
MVSSSQQFGGEAAPQESGSAGQKYFMSGHGDLREDAALELCRAR